MHLGLKRNFQVMPGAQWLELLCRHNPHRYEHLIRYVGWYSNRSRGERQKASQAQAVPATLAAPINPHEQARRACESRLGAADSQSLCSRSARMPRMQRHDARDRTGLLPTPRARA
jgi:hypothetical protein